MTKIKTVVFLVTNLILLFLMAARDLPLLSKNAEFLTMNPTAIECLRLGRNNSYELRLSEKDTVLTSFKVLDDCENLKLKLLSAEILEIQYVKIDSDKLFLSIDDGNEHLFDFQEGLLELLLGQVLTIFTINIIMGCFFWVSIKRSV